MIKIIQNINELESIESEWNDLFEESSGSNVFQSFDWNYIWLKHFLRKNDNIFIIAVYNDKENGKLEAIAPFFIRRFFLFLKSLMFISYDYSDYLDIIIRKNCDKEKIYAEIFNTVLLKNKSNKIADIIYLKQVSKKTLNLISEYLQKIKKISLNFKESGNCYYFNLPDNIEEYMKRFNSKQRYNILKRVEKADDVNIKYSACSSVNTYKSLFEKYLNIFFELHQKRWQGKGKRGVFYNDDIKSFFKELFISLFNKNRITLSTLKINDGNIIASAVCFDYADKKQIYLPGFDTAYSGYHPGIVLIYNDIKESINKKYKELDFLKGGEEYKQRFGAIKRENYKLYLYKNKIYFYIYKINIFFENEVKEKTVNIVNKMLIFFKKNKN
ncbi:MAG: GNAT family N-acetyltransferase [Deltaproteobacteria bacterium]|jgi:CelD/BcsL family acetyltransferase involved in cellulose biosynthesis|nr:GNAT family N-acetyltransferase [Deltaproteobacteria bacterium]MDA8298616.1 GNAT family N-acetyltransferase [Deltaproteobacteria bacterium]